MKSTSPGRVAQITHATGLAENFHPRHFVQMVLECHRMRYEFQAFVQATIRLYIQIFTISIGDVQQLLRVAVHRAAVINFELHAEMPQAFAVEHKVGRVAVFVNNIVVLIPAGCAVSVVVIIPIRAVTMNDTVAVLAADVLLIKAVVAKRVRIVLDGVFLVDPLGAVVADDSQPVGAILAEPVTFYLIHILDRVLCTAVCTNPRFLHWLFLHFIW